MDHFHETTPPTKLKSASDWAQRFISPCLILSLASCEPTQTKLPECTTGKPHEWGQWENHEKDANGYVDTVTFQSRDCQVCGWKYKVKHQQKFHQD